MAELTRQNMAKLENNNYNHTCNSMLISFLAQHGYKMIILVPAKSTSKRDSRSCLFVSKIIERNTGEIIFDSKDNQEIDAEHENLILESYLRKFKTDQKRKEWVQRHLKDYRLKFQFDIMIELTNVIIQTYYNPNNEIIRSNIIRGLKSLQVPKFVGNADEKIPL